MKINADGSRETSPDGSLDLSKSEPDQIPVFVDAAKKNVGALRFSRPRLTGLGCESAHLDRRLDWQ